MLGQREGECIAWFSVIEGEEIVGQGGELRSEGDLKGDR